MSAGEFFELVRPVFLIASALLSLLVLAHAQRSGLRPLPTMIWALATFLLPLVTLPIYLLFRISHVRESRPEERRTHAGSAVRLVSERLLLPFFYAVAIFTLIAFSQYREYSAVDAYLARAKQAKLEGDRSRTIREYKAALALDDDPHTHKLLGIELYDDGDWSGALSQFRLAERGGEDDETLSFRIAKVLDLLNQRNQAGVEYKKFLYSKVCREFPLDDKCEKTQKRLSEILKSFGTTESPIGSASKPARP